MTAERDKHPWPLVIGLLAIVSSLSGVTNLYVQDDIPVIQTNPVIHDLHKVGRIFTEAYWPPPFVPAVYRPLSSVWYALQWLAGGGSPLAFRLVSYLLYALTAALVFRLARARLPLPAAAACAALFAVHPVHVEAVAVAVNQSELWVGLLCCLATTVYLQARAEGGPLTGKTQLLLAGLYLAACLFKETGLVLPGLLLAAELFLVPATEPLRTRISQGRQLLLMLTLVALASYWLRTAVLSGNLVGVHAAEGLLGLTMGQRALTMLAVVPHWVRLLFWPAHLRADYSPGVIVAQTAWGAAHWFGLVLLLATVVIAVAARRRAPVITFGIAWCAIALFPVHNVLVPTGIVLAERTLFLPSIGAMLALGGAGALLLEGAPPRTRLLLAAATGALLVLGMVRSIARHPVWQDTLTLWYRTANEDAPRSFRAHAALAEQYFSVGQEHMGEQEYRLAIQFAPPMLTGLPIQLADRLRNRGFCYPAAQLYRRVVELEPENSRARVSLVACLVNLGQYREAIFHARMGISFDWARDRFQRAFATADSAQRVSAPPGTVRVSVAAGDPVGEFMTIGDKK